MEKQKLQSMVPIHAPDLNKLFDSDRDADKARVILQHLFHVRLMMKKNTKYAGGLNREERWCPMLASNLESLVRDYSRIMKVLVEKRIIEYRKNEKGTASYYPGKYSKVYRPVFPEFVSHGNGPKYRRESITTPGVIRAVGRYYSKRYERQVGRVLSTTPWYKSCLNFMDRLWIDIEQEGFDNFDPEDRDRRMIQVEEFNTGIRKHVSRGEYGRRIYSHVANLPRDLRPYLRLSDESEPLVLLDVKSSQPYFMSALFRYPGLLYLIPEFEPVGNVISQCQHSMSTRMFFEDCKNGVFYDKLMVATGLEKKPLKDLLFGHVFYATSYKHRDDEDLGRTRMGARHLFGMSYRDPLHVLDRLKETKRLTLPFVYDHTETIGKGGRVYGKMYATPNMMTARLESCVLLDLVTKTCVEEGIETCTLHDAWILKASDVERFKEIFSNVLNRIGIPCPKLNEEALNRPAILS